MSHEMETEILNHIFNPLLPTGELSLNQVDVEVQAEDEETEESIVAKRLELEGIRAAETGDTESAVKLFSEAIRTLPSRASCYNNRAQALRLVNDIQGALKDLNTAINLSHGVGRAASQAFCQRGLINHRENRQEEARSDFQAAALLGSRFAKSQLVQMNPYAALCNKMLRDVIGKLQRGETDENENC